MNTDEVISLAGISAAVVMVVQFLRNMLGPKILNGRRTQGVAMLISLGAGYLAAQSSREFNADTDDIIGTIVLVFLLGQSIYNLALRNTALESAIDGQLSKITKTGDGSDASNGKG